MRGGAGSSMLLDLAPGQRPPRGMERARAHQAARTLARSGGRLTDASSPCSDRLARNASVSAAAVDCSTS